MVQKDQVEMKYGNNFAFTLQPVYVYRQAFYSEVNKRLNNDVDSKAAYLEFFQTCPRHVYLCIRLFFIHLDY